MASTVAIPQFYNFPGAIPGPLPGPMPGALPPATIPITTAYGANPSNGAAPFQNVPLHTMQVPIVPVGGGCYNDGMEVVWHGEFSRLFSTFYPPHVWYLTITNSAPPLKWKFHRDSAKVRFCCQDCGNGWTSMKGRVTFWFHLDYATNNGYVQFKLYGQQCKKCNSGKFEYVMWYPEEVSKVMCNVYNKVGQTYYGFLQPPIRIDRRPGRPRNQHNSDLCQACRDGECDQARPIKSLYNMGGMIQAPVAIPAPPVQEGLETATSGSSPAPASQPATVVQTYSTPQSSEVTVSASTSNTTNHGVITSPITLTGGMQPILTYSIISAPPKSAALSATSTHFVPQNPPPAPANAHYIYHPNAFPLMNGTIPGFPPPPPALPILPAKPAQISKPPAGQVNGHDEEDDVCVVINRKQVETDNCVEAKQGAEIAEKVESPKTENASQLKNGNEQVNGDEQVNGIPA